MYGYGALGWSVYPWFQPQMVVWLERGGIFALPGTRGGGEYGESWHRAGSARNRQNAIDDYIAAAQWLVENRYSSAGQIVASGSSLGAALPAAAAQQRPDLFGAALIDIPVLDLIRYERHTGALMWKSELGSVSDAEDFRVLLAYSPVHNVHRTGGCARPTLVTAGSRDETAVPSHAFKYVAALQHAQSCTAPVLLQLVEGAGHGYGTTPQQMATTWAMQLAFVERALAMSQIGKSN
jgi:prolyl oligopeptidase